MAAARRNRPYESPLRAEQMDRTREKLIEAAVDLVVDEGGEELTVRRVAARAGVSVPTAYRYFPDRDVLLQQMANWINDRIAGGPWPSSMPEANGWVKGIYKGFEENDKFMRAQLITPAGRAIRAANQKSRHASILTLVKNSHPEASETSLRRMAALVQLLVNVPAWVSLHDNWGMNGKEAGDVAVWAIDVLYAELRRNPRALDGAGDGVDAAAAAPPVSAPPSKRSARARDSKK